ARTKSAGGDSASRSPRDRARCGGPTRREGSPGREDLTSFLRGRSGAALAAVLPALFAERNAKILPPKSWPADPSRENSPVDCFPARLSLDPPCGGQAAPVSRRARGVTAW